MSNRTMKNPDAFMEASPNIKVDIGYTSYTIHVTSNEINRAIDYTIQESSIGIGYAWEGGSVGITTKVVLDELKSHLTLEQIDNPLHDKANINKQDFSLYANYTLSKHLGLNAVYKYIKLQSNDTYNNFYDYDTHFNYTTNGVALSLVYTYPIGYAGSALSLSMGLLYSGADVEIYEMINGVANDTYIDEQKSAWGSRWSIGYLYEYNNHTATFLVDWYHLEFDRLGIQSHFLQKSIDEALLVERTYSVRFGYVYQF